MKPFTTETEATDWPKDGVIPELIALRKTLGMDDKHANWKECELCDNADFQPGTVCRVPDSSGSSEPAVRLDADAEKLVQALTDQILAGMK